MGSHSNHFLSSSTCRQHHISLDNTLGKDYHLFPLGLHLACSNFPSNNPCRPFHYHNTFHLDCNPHHKFLGIPLSLSLACSNLEMGSHSNHFLSSSTCRQHHISLDNTLGKDYHLFPLGLHLAYSNFPSNNPCRPFHYHNTFHPDNCKPHHKFLRIPLSLSLGRSNRDLHSHHPSSLSSRACLHLRISLDQDILGKRLLVESTR